MSYSWNEPDDRYDPPPFDERIDDVIDEEFVGDDWNPADDADFVAWCDEQDQAAQLDARAEAESLSDYPEGIPF